LPSILSSVRKSYFREDHFKGGRSDATFTVEECIPLVADVLEKNHGKAGPRYVDRFDKTLPW
jgi:hypothetical protein